MKRLFNKYSMPLKILSAGVIGIPILVGLGRHEAESVRRSRVSVDLRDLSKAVEDYHAAAGSFPTTKEGLEALVSPPHAAPAKWKQIIKKVPFDAWGNDYRYRLANRKKEEMPEVYSCGSDGVPDTKDDLSSLD